MPYLRKTSLPFLLLLFLTSGVFAQSTNYPAGFLYDQAHIKIVKTSLGSGERKYQAVFQYLLREAKKALDEKALCVTEKKQLPPSGDKHDFMSLAPYHWPDPSKPNGLPYIRKDGRRNPEYYEIPDQEYLGKTMKRIHLLSLAYYFSGDQKYAEKANRLIQVWFLNADTKMNPNLNFSQAVKGENEGRGSGIIESRDFILLIDALTLLDDGRGLDEDTKSGIRRWLNEFLTWLTTSKNGVQESKAKNNHGTWYAAQALSIALYLGRQETVQKILQGIEARIASQIEPDGRQPLELVRTTSLGYCHFNVIALSQLFIIAKALGKEYWFFETADGRSLKKAVDFLYPFANEDEDWTYEQIKEPNNNELAMSYVYAFYFWKESKYLELAKKLDEDELNRSLLRLTLADLK